METFATNFYSQYNDLAKQLNELQVKDSSNESELNELRVTFDVIGNKIQLLQNSFNDHTSCLAAYEQRKAQDHLEKLKSLTSQRRSDLFPKKKFAFKSKKNLTDSTKVISQTLVAHKTQEQEVSSTNSIEALSIHTCTIKDTENETITKYEDEVNGADIGIANLKNCVVKLYGHPSVLHLSNIEDSVILCGPMSGSAFISKCKNCKLNLTAHQIRIHESYNTDFYINVASRAIIEYCKDVRFAPYAWLYLAVEKHFKASGFSFLDKNLPQSWRNIDDFNWLVTTQKSPNWSFIDEGDRSEWNESEIVGEDNGKNIL